MTTRILKPVLVCFTILALVLAMGTGVDAKKKHHHKKKHKKNSASSTLTIDSATAGQSTIRGDMSSPKDLCIEDRVVRVTRGSTALGSATTDSSGGWQTSSNTPLVAGETINARVDKVTRKSGKKKVDCGADSDSFTVAGATAGQNRNLNVNVTNAGGGTGQVNSNPAGISNCRAAGDPDPGVKDCAGAYPARSDVTLTAVPDGGSAFAGWSGCTTVNGNQCVVHMDDNRNVAAAFNSTGGPAPVPDVCAPTGTALDPILCIVIELLGG